MYNKQDNLFISSFIQPLMLHHSVFFYKYILCYEFSYYMFIIDIKHTKRYYRNLFTPNFMFIKYHINANILHIFKYNIPKNFYPHHNQLPSNLPTK